MSPLLQTFLKDRRCADVAEFMDENSPDNWTAERLRAETAVMERLLEAEASVHEATSDDAFAGFAYGALAHMDEAKPS